SPNANFGPASETVGGVLPTKTLGLPDMVDPWGRRYSYHIDRRATELSAFTIYRLTSPLIGDIIVNNSGGGTKTTKGVVLVMSHGPNGHGAFLTSGQRFKGMTTSANEFTNC